MREKIEREKERERERSAKGEPLKRPTQKATERERGRGERGRERENNGIVERMNAREIQFHGGLTVITITLVDCVFLIF